MTLHPSGTKAFMAVSDTSNDMINEVDITPTIDIARLLLLTSALTNLLTVELSSKQKVVCYLLVGLPGAVVMQSSSS